MFKRLIEESRSSVLISERHFKQFSIMPNCSELDNKFEHRTENLQHLAFLHGWMGIVRALNGKGDALITFASRNQDLISRWSLCRPQGGLHCTRMDYMQIEVADNKRAIEPGSCLFCFIYWFAFWICQLI